MDEAFLQDLLGFVVHNAEFECQCPHRSCRCEFANESSECIRSSNGSTSISYITPDSICMTIILPSDPPHLPGNKQNSFEIISVR